LPGKRSIDFEISLDAFAPQVPMHHCKETSEVWNGTPGFSTERWRFWKERIRELKELPEVLDIAKTVADETIAEMNRIEATAEEHPPFDSRFGPKAWYS
jgi:hypothetical protein